MTNIAIFWTLIAFLIVLLSLGCAIMLGLAATKYRAEAEELQSVADEMNAIATDALEDRVKLLRAMTIATNNTTKLLEAIDVMGGNSSEIPLETIPEDCYSDYEGDLEGRFDHIIETLKSGGNTNA